MRCKYCNANGNRLTLHRLKPLDGVAYRYDRASNQYLETMYKWNDVQLEEIQKAIDYLKGSKYYSDTNQSSTY